MANGASLISIVSPHVRLGQTESTHTLTRTRMRALFSHKQEVVRLCRLNCTAGIKVHSRGK